MEGMSVKFIPKYDVRKVRGKKIWNQNKENLFSMLCKNKIKRPRGNKAPRGLGRHTIVASVRRRMVSFMS